MLVLVGLVGCSSSCSRAGEGSTRARPASIDDDGPRSHEEAPSGSKPMHVGNQVGGLAEMPDYDREALDVRAAVVDRLPDPLPDAATACAQMLTSARTYYMDTEGPTSQAVSAVDAAREADLAACRQVTPPAVAVCVTLLSEERWAEYPKLLDQCTRAFPARG